MEPLSAYEKAQSVKLSASKLLAAISEDRTLSESGRRAKLTEAHEAVKRELLTLKREHAAEAAEHRSMLERRAFGSPSDARLADFREAVRRANALPTEDDALLALATAKLTNDTLTAKAVAASASRRGWVGAVRGYADDFGGSESIDALDAHDRIVASPQERSAVDLAFSVLPPVELQGRHAMSDAERQQQRYDERFGRGDSSAA